MRARWSAGARRLQVDASSLPGGAPHRISTQSFGLYPISSASARARTSLSVSVWIEPSLRVYSNRRDTESVTSSSSSSARTAAADFPAGVASARLGGEAAHDVEFVKNRPQASDLRLQGPEFLGSS